ncbi:MAG: DUF3048 domain-containing protein [Lachnospiraceae bacterium]|nr:DUF3048 domain-containing protein [Lachnospiraceae bacterium]
MKKRTLEWIRRQALMIAVFTLVIAVAAACGKKDEASEEDFEIDQEEVGEAEEEEEEEPAGNLSLLTNEPLDEERVGKRPVSIMIENTRMALPQYGLNEAGVVYECPAEGGITRFLAVFDDYSDMERIGNVRSCRPYYAYIAAEYDSIYLHYGQSIHGKEVLDSGVVDDLNGLDGEVERIVYYRSSDKKAPHNAYTSTEGIDNGIEKKGYETDYEESNPEGHFTFAEEENTLPDGDDAEKVSLYFPTNNPYYVYDEDEKLYTRYQFGAPETDAVDGNEVKAANLILQNVSSSIFPGTEYLDIALNGSGSGKFITRGKAVDITWSKDSNSDITHYYYDNGDEIELNSGQTWVHLIENAGVDRCSITGSEDSSAAE